ncbi:mannosyltransferase, partial [Oleoguttula sp. CCFEE 5521]
MDWLSILEIFLPIVLVLSTALTVFIITLPEQYSNFKPRVILDSDFTAADQEDPERSGHAYFQHHKDADGTLRCPTSVQVVVLGDIGRSPRMQYHALSIAAHGGKVSLVGYIDSDVHPGIEASRFIDVIPIARFPSTLQTDNKLLFLLLAPLKVLHQVLSLYTALSYKTPASNWTLVQNPPSIPTLAVARVICFFRKTKLVIDWHNFGYSILALRLGSTHPLVRLSH